MSFVKSEEITISLVKSEEITIQINGKSRGRIKIPFSASDTQILKIAENSNEFQKYCQNKVILRTIIVPNRLINIVVKK